MSYYDPKYDYDDSDDTYDDKNWIYIGGDIRNANWSKVGKTTNGLDTRHRSPQNPGYFIYTAFQIICGDIHEIERKLLEHLTYECDLEREIHFSTGNPSECFRHNPDNMTYIVESFIEKKYSACVTYENSLHGDMSRYRCDDHICRYYQNYDNLKKSSHPFEPLSLGRRSYFSGNQEVHEVYLGDGYYLDTSSCLLIHRDD